MRRKVWSVAKDVMAWLLLIAFAVAFVALIAFCDRVLDARYEAADACRKHGYLGAALHYGEWVCDGIEDGLAVKVLLSKVEMEGNR